MPEETAKRAESSSPWGMWIRSGTGGEGTATFHFKPKELFDLKPYLCITLIDTKLHSKKKECPRVVGMEIHTTKSS